MVVESKKWVLAKKIEGMPKPDNFSLVTEKLRDCEDGEVLFEAEHLTVDPYMRISLSQSEIGDTVMGAQVAKVVESKNEAYPVGSYMCLHCGWRSHFLLTKEYLEKDRGIHIADYFLYEEQTPRSTALGVLGMPGMTAYFGFLRICEPKEGDVAVVSGAAGAVGSIVCQIAKIKGCKVIGFAGSDDKLAWLKELGVDVVSNYKTEDVSDVLSKAAPNGVNCYFDNVGGEFTRKILSHMAPLGRISVCGGISTYNNTIHEDMNSPFTTKILIFKQLKVEGFLVYRWSTEFKEAVATMSKWIGEGKLKFKETVTKGFENMPEAFIGLFTGANTGKALITV